MTDLTFQLPRLIFFAYGSLAIALSSVLLVQSLGRGLGELVLWSVAFVGVGAFSVRRPQHAPLVAGFAALLLGWAKTHHRGYTLDLGLSLIALSVGLYVLDRVRRKEQGPSLDIPGFALLSVAVWSLVSLAFTLVRIRSFTPAPGFAYRYYPFNSLGFSSEEAVIRATIGATAMFVWFGLYEYARSERIRRERLSVAVFVVLLINFAALVWQTYADETFLLPHGFAPMGRLNGVTSFCYALGDVALALYLLLPVWGSSRGVRAVLTVGSVLMLVHSASASGSRTALVAIFVVTLLWISVHVPQLFRARRRIAASLSLAGVVTLLSVGAVTYLVTPPDEGNALGRLRMGVRDYGLYGVLFETRLRSYPLIFRVMGEYPLSGVGAGLYLAEASKQRALLMPELELAEQYLLTSYAPNQFLNTGVELGVPAMLALVLVFIYLFVSAATSAWRGRWRVGSADLAVSLLALGGALQLGPSLYNSEALVFFWLIVGMAAREGAGSDPGGPRAHARVSSSAAAALVVGSIVLGIVGQVMSRSSLAVEDQWRRLRWRLVMGMEPPEAGGLWTRPEATFVVDTTAPTAIVRWHTGDQAVRDYTAEVSFYVDGALVERSPAVSGRVRESVLPLPAVPGFKRISVRVSPPFVPAETSGGDDWRRLGIFIHSVTP